MSEQTFAQRVAELEADLLAGAPGLGLTIHEVIAALREQQAALALVQAGLRNGSIKARPVISFGPGSESADMQTVDEIVSAVLSKWRLPDCEWLHCLDCTYQTQPE